MSALFESIASTLGRAGGGYAAARDTATEQANQAQAEAFNQAQKIRDYLEQKRRDDLTAQVQGALQKSRTAGNVIDLGTTQDAQGNWYRKVYNLETHQMMTVPTGTPESVVRTTSEENLITQRQKDLEDQRQANREALRKMIDTQQLKLREFIHSHPNATRGGSIGGLPRAVYAWYRVLHDDQGRTGPQLDAQIRTLDQFLALLPPNDATFQQYEQQLVQLTEARSALLDQAMTKAAGEKPTGGSAGGGANVSGGIDITTKTKGSAIPRPPNATMKVPGDDGHMHWSDGTNDLGRAD